MNKVMAGLRRDSVYEQLKARQSEELRAYREQICHKVNHSTADVSRGALGRDQHSAG